MRRQPVAFALMDANFLSDPKFRKLARRLPDPDDFNSAVGAYWIALASARRNGLPTIDFASETDSSFLPDLLAVGLIVEDGFPCRAFKDWAPSRRPRPSEAIAPSVSSGVESVESDASAVSSTPLPSTQLSSSTEGGPGETDRDPAVALHERTGTFPSEKVLSWLNELGDTHGEDRVVAAIDRTPMGGRNLRDYMVAVRDVLRAEDHHADKAERDAEKVRVKELRKPTVLRVRPPEVSDEEADREAREYMARNRGVGA